MTIEQMALLGYRLYSSARYAEAEQVFVQLTRSAPREPMYWSNLGTARRNQGKLDAALAAFARAAELGAASADFFFNVGLAHLDRRDYESARAVLGKALGLAPRDAGIRLEYVRACYESLHTEEALAALESWQGLEDLKGEHLAAAGLRLMNLGESQRAEEVVQRLATAELDARSRLTLVQILERTNRLREAGIALQRLQADPAARELGADLATVQAQIAQREARHDEASTLFAQALESVTDVASRHYLQFPLARSLDALGRHEQAFATLREAHRSQLEHLKLTAPMAVARGMPTMAIADFPCDPSDAAAWSDPQAPSTADSPIFIVGFPRSGTTLLEQALDAHPQVRSTDEQPFVQNALDDLMATGARYPEQLARVTPDQLQAIRAKYWERLRRKVPFTAGERIVDKNPLNLLRLPAIHRLFPNARIVLAVRHPCDVMMSCYMQHFRAPEFALVCRTLDTLAANYRRAFDFWYAHAGLLRPAVFELRYERFVADFERQLRELSAFLELRWDDAMLAVAGHAQRRGYISTPSYAQVVEPVNARAVGRWKAYEPHFAGALATLRPYLERWGYEIGGGAGGGPLGNSR